MNANIQRHAFTDYSGTPYIDSYSMPVMVNPYVPPPTHAPVSHRTIIRTNKSNQLPPLPNTSCGCDSKYAPAPALAPRPKMAPAPRPKMAPALRPQMAPAFPQYAPVPRPILRPSPLPHSAPTAAPHVSNLINDNGQWAESARKDNMYIVYVENC